jgi:hypothetical protein
LIGINSPNLIRDEDEAGRQTIREGACMTTLNKESKPADLADQRDIVADGYIQGPMSQQAALGSHGYDIYPQTFVRLVGCHQSNAAQSDAARPLRTAA